MTENRAIYPATGQIAGAADQFSSCRVTNSNSRGLELPQIHSTEAQALFPGENPNIRERTVFRTNDATDCPLPRLTPSRPRAVRSTRAEPARADAKRCS